MDANDSLPAFHSTKVLYAAKAKGRLRLGLFAQIQTSPSGLETGRGLSRTALTTLKIVVLPPMPSAKAITASAVTPGLRASMRKPNRMSCSMSPPLGQQVLILLRVQPEAFHQSRQIRAQRLRRGCHPRPNHRL